MLIMFICLPKHLGKQRVYIWQVLVSRYGSNLSIIPESFFNLFLTIVTYSCFLFWYGTVYNIDINWSIYATNRIIFFFFSLTSVSQLISHWTCAGVVIFFLYFLLITKKTTSNAIDAYIDIIICFFATIK